jgi:tetratricopeptide (TPR) repeat protein
MKITSPDPHIAHSTTNAEALLSCQTALEQKDKGDYRGAQDAMRRLWKALGERPNVEGLDASVKAEVFLCVGILTGWIGSKTQIIDAQETAKNLITESITYFESIGDLRNIALARTEIAYCYFRQGELNEARIILREALNKLTTEGLTRARALLKLAIVEEAASRYNDALRILTDNAALFEKLTDYMTKGQYHNQLATTSEEIAVAENRREFFQQAIAEYKAADQYFKLARNPIFRASVKNNVAVVLSKLSRFKEAHKYLNGARRLAVDCKDRAQAAQIDWTRAEVLVAEGKLKQAESLANKAARALRKSGHHCFVSDALTTQGIALARLGQTDRAQFIFRKAVEAALKVNALNKAGLAALTLIEEVDELSPAILQATYSQAWEWLSDSQSSDVLSRLNRVAGKVVSNISKRSAGEFSEILLSQGSDLNEKLLHVEREMIRQALAQAKGGVSQAARILGLSHQGLAYIIQSRHRELLKERSPVRRRARKDSLIQHSSDPACRESGRN